MEITAAIVKEKRANFELTKVILDKPASEEVLVKIDINHAVGDSEKVRTIKSALKIGEYTK